MIPERRQPGWTRGPGFDYSTGMPKTMIRRLFQASIILAALVFLAVFSLYTLPAAIEMGDVVQAFAGGFVNPLATGYSTDAVCCWFILAFWILYEAKTAGVRHGWVCVALGVVPGVAVGFAAYLLIREVGPKSQTASS